MVKQETEDQTVPRTRTRNRNHASPPLQRGRRPSFSADQELITGSFKLPADVIIMLGIAAVKERKPKNVLVDEALRAYFQ